MAPPIPHLQSRKVGSLNVHAIQAGGLRLDGGAMFGVVPKPLWERQIPADDRNRIALGMRCLLVDHPSGLVLIDSGLGNKENEKFLDIYGIENAGRGGRTALEDGLASLGVRPEDISLVINTHLHFDHGGGNTYRDEAGVVRPSFPRARYIVQRGEFDYATHTNERTAASYFNPNFVPLRDAGVLDLIEGEREIVQGIRVIASPGHVPFHQSVVIESGGETALFLADVMPTSAHVPLPWIMGYDVEPLVTLETKRSMLGHAARNGWLVIFEHDAAVASGRLVADGKGFALGS
jgi:glyoxylase-like metal-dependent hydrolase (beta-lactamase superfamily II)